MEKNPKLYAEFIASIRGFFSEDNVLEVHTKTLLQYPTLDNNIDSIKVNTNSKFKQKSFYLHTSPELEMKKILAKYPHNIYQITQVYRDNEVGSKNFNEFIMLEFYLVNKALNGLIEYTLKLFKSLRVIGKVYYFSYAQLLKKYANIDINLGYQQLQKFAINNGLASDLTYSDLQILIWVHFVEKHLRKYDVCVVYDFPTQQSAYAKVINNVAKRFEVYIKGVEIANGYEELRTYTEYLAVFKQQAEANNLAINNNFLDFIENNPLPACSGVAIGVDRLFQSIN